MLNHRELRALIDFAEPAGFLITAVVHFMTDDVDPYGILARYKGALASGSYLSLTHMTADKNPPQAVKAVP